jgi:threonine dehydratase
MKVTLDDIRKAHTLIRDQVQLTPIQTSTSASHETGSEIFFKMENEQTAGSFKIRGALNRILNLSDSEKRKGVIASSAGNHAQGVALAAKKAGVTANVVMPVTSSIIKQIATRNYGANVILHGELYDDAYQKARALEKEKGYVFVHPFEDPLIIAGQGTVGIEIADAIPRLDSVVVPIGGGGLISGVAIAIKALQPNCKIYGVVAENAPGMKAMFKKQPMPANTSFVSIADGISVKKPSPEMYEHFISKYVDDVVAVSEDDIASAIVFLLERAKTVVEGSGAVGYAAARKGKLKLGKKSCVVLSGGNIDLNLVASIIERGLGQSGRLARMTVIVPDRPGQLNLLTRIFAECGANILEVEHDRLAPNLQVRETMISVLVETRSAEHAQELRNAITRAGLTLKEG